MVNGTVNGKNAERLDRSDEGVKVEGARIDAYGDVNKPVIWTH